MHRKRKIIFVNQYTGYLFIDVVNAFAKDYECKLLAGEIVETNTPLAASVQKINLIKYSRNNSIKRIYTWSVFTVQAFFKLLFEEKTADLFIVTNPPFAPFLGYLFNKTRGTKYHLLIYDVYPDALVQFKKANKRGIINKGWSRLNGHLFKHASSIFTLSSNMSSLIKAYCDGATIHVVPNWTDTSFIRPLFKDENFFAKEYHQQKKITVMYSGNMGATHAVEKVAVLASYLKDDKYFGFMVIGDGVKKTQVQKMKEERQLDNLIILPFQSAKVLPYSLTCADVGIVTLSSGAEDLSVPSKTYNLLAAGVVLLVIASPESELAKLVEKYNCGRHFQENQIEGMIEFLLTLKGSPEKLKQLKENSRKASFDFTSVNAQQYKLLINKKIHVPDAAETCY